MKQFFIAAALAVCASLSLAAPTTQPFRPPAVPLVTNDPYLSIWSEADHLTDDVTRHWTRKPHALESLIRVDGKAYRLMGNAPKEAPAFPQTEVQVLPTRSIYNFDDGHVHVTLTFFAPALPNDLDALSRPLSYITWAVRSVDGATHAISLYDSVSSELAVHTTDQVVTCERTSAGPLVALRTGTVEQPTLVRAGDGTRIDWGYAYLAASAKESKSVIGAEEGLLDAFASTGELPSADDAKLPRAAKEQTPTLAVSFALGTVGEAPVSRHVIVAYDEIYSIKYFGKKLRPYWRRHGAEAADMLQAAERDYAVLNQRCEAFDKELWADLTAAGGEKYAQIAALAYREAFAGCGLAADENGQPLLLTKENTSNGDIATVDVIFPMEPIVLLFSPALTKASLVSVLDYSASSHWKFPNAPHDLGTYPKVFGRDDGGEGMPVEESGNMLILLDALAQVEGNADFSVKYWPQLTQWATYLEKYGLDPENQLCTDDFMGHLAHNANLSIKAILGLAAYGDLCRIRGDEVNAKRYAEIAKTDAENFMKVGMEGDHSLLAFDKPNTWSQKYNLAWDHILGLNVFPPSLAEKEIAFYKTQLQPFGVPLDSRTKLTKSDWSIWAATMAEHPADFEALISPIYDYLDQTTTRDPLADSYTTTNIKSGGMHARPVVGGMFIRMLAEPALWKKWSSEDKQKVGPWAPLPLPPELVEVVPTGRQETVTWHYTIDKPSADWTSPQFDDSSWKQGAAPFGTKGTKGIEPNTTWKTDDIWLRREVTLPTTAIERPTWVLFHDEDVEIYVNGVLAGQEPGYEVHYIPVEITAAGLKLLQPGAKVMLAVHCRQTKGGQGIDVGLANEVDKKP